MLMATDINVLVQTHVFADLLVSLEELFESDGIFSDSVRIVEITNDFFVDPSSEAMVITQLNDPLGQIQSLR